MLLQRSKLMLFLSLLLQENGIARRRTNLSGKTFENPRKVSHGRARKVDFFHPVLLFSALFLFLGVTVLSDRARRGHRLCGQRDHHERRGAHPADDDGEREDDHGGGGAGSGKGRP